MSGVGVAARAALALLLGVLASACLRLDVPDTFSCSSNLDCPASEHCVSGGVCKPKGECSQLLECAEDETCQNGKCVHAQCSAGHAAACGAYSCDTYQRTCNSRCQGRSAGCSEGYRCSNASTCEARPDLANGKSCTDETDCASGICCGSGATTRVCAASCGSDGDACTTAGECRSGRCCAQKDMGLRCQNDACTPQPPGSPCTLPDGCSSGYCINGVCTKHACQRDYDCDDGFCAAGACETRLRDLGGACETTAWCKSGSCTGGVCRGDATGGARCETDYDCEEGRVCCASPPGTSFTCSALGKGCDGANGDSCYSGAACSSGQCLSSTMCTQTCAVDADCGTSPWGSKNHCLRNGVDDFVCFPGCKNDGECEDVDAFLICTSGVCAGDQYSPAPLQLW
jgi:hypothetical protein